MKPKVYIETHGCQMNVADTERATTRLRHAGYELVTEHNEADVVVLNTCSVRERAEVKVSNRIGRIAHGTDGRKPLIGITGCVAQLKGVELFRQSSVIDFVVGTGATDRLPSVIERVLRGERQVSDLTGRNAGEVWDIQPADRLHNATAFVPIVEGCNKFCSYCIVPYSRGREKSRSAVSIVSEVHALYQAGFKEVQLIGQNVNSYRPQGDSGLEGFSGATPFVRLLYAVAGTGIPRIKFTTSFPRDFHADIVRAIEACENICNWVHLPVQSGSDGVLKRMRRGYKSSDYLEKIAAIKASGRRIALTTDLIIGFPGETDEDFAQTLELVKQCSFHGIYIFKYSQRSGTHAAANFIDNVPPTEKARRFRQLESLQNTLQEKVYKSYVGRRLSVLVNGRSARHSEVDAVGHSTCHKVVNFRSPLDLTGQIVDVRITTAKRNSLYGELI